MFQWFTGNTKPKTNKISFEDIQWILKQNNNKYLLINTLPKNEQKCLIQKTMPIDKEVDVINGFLKDKTINIVIYGKNTNDPSIYLKYNQLINLGFYKVYIYLGGLFEWLCLQDIYGKSSFPTIGEELDILKYRAPPEINKNYYIANK